MGKVKPDYIFVIACFTIVTVITAMDFAGYFAPAGSEANIIAFIVWFSFFTAGAIVFRESVASHPN